MHFFSSSGIRSENGEPENREPEKQRTRKQRTRKTENQKTQNQNTENQKTENQKKIKLKLIVCVMQEYERFLEYLCLNYLFYPDSGETTERR